MTNLTKFLAIGAIALGFAQSTNAANLEQTNTEQLKAQISQSISQSIKKQFELGFLKEKAQVNINILNEIDAANIRDMEEASAMEGNFSIVKSTSFNNLSRINNECVVNLVYDENGNLPSLINSTIIKDVTKLQNENQKTIAQKFVALHEHHHCEFTNINEPIIAFNKDSKFNSNINFLLKDHHNPYEKSSYYEMLNENYADVSAALSLLKEYGTNNPDLNFVIKVLTTQRHAGYFEHAQDSHSTHFSLEQILTKDTFVKLNNVNDSQSFENLALEIANKGVQKVFVEQPDLIKATISKESIQYSIATNISGEVFKQSLSAQELAVSPSDIYGKNIERGFSNVTAQKAISFYDLNPLKEERAKNDGEINMAIYKEFTKRVYDSMKDNLGKKEYSELQNKITYSSDQLKIFTSSFPKLEIAKTANLKVNKGMLGKIEQLRKDFVESNKDNKSQLSM